MPERSSEEEDSFRNEDFSDSKGRRGSDGLVALFVELFEDWEEDIVGEIEERCWSSGRGSFCNESIVM